MAWAKPSSLFVIVKIFNCRDTSAWQRHFSIEMPSKHLHDNYIFQCFVIREWLATLVYPASCNDHIRLRAFLVKAFFCFSFPSLELQFVMNTQKNLGSCVVFLRAHNLELLGIQNRNKGIKFPKQRERGVPQDMIERNDKEQGSVRCTAIVLKGTKVP